MVADLSRFARRVAVELHAANSMRRAGLLGLEPPGQVREIARAISAYGQIGGALVAAEVRHGNRTALVDERGELSFAELNRRSNALANAWRARGLTERDTLAILCRNHRGFVEAVFASAKVGARTLLLNTDFAAPQLADVCARERVTALVYDDEFAPALGDLEFPRGRFIAHAVQPGPGTDPRLAELITASPGAPPPPPSRHASIVLLTSGTTGTPKGAPREEPRSLAPLGALLSKIPFRSREATYIGAPMFHALGFAHTLLALSLGSRVITRRRFDAAEALETVAAERATAMVVVPVMLQRMVAGCPELIEELDLSRLRIVFVAGAQLEGQLAIAAMEAFGDCVYNLYGSTEVAWATIATPADLRAAPGCAGRPPFGTRVRLYDDTGRPIEVPGITGRIFVGNGFAFNGYTDGQGKEAIDGLMSTGDVGHFDPAGRLFIDGRDDEMIVSGGENVFPREVEELLAGHPSIEEAAVLGVPDPEFGQALAAFIVARSRARLSADDVQEYVKANLARYKVPRQVHFVAELPRNPSGKVLKRELASAT